MAEGCVRPCTSSFMAVRGWRWIPRAVGTGNELGEATKRSDSGSGAVTCQCCAGWVRDGAASLPAAGGPPRHDEGERGGAVPNSYAECVLSTAGSDRWWGRGEAKVHLESGRETARCSASRSHRVDGCAQGLRPGGAAAQG